MSDWVIRDAIRLYEESRTASGHRLPEGDEAHRERYRRLARNVEQRAVELWNENEIGYHDIGGSWGVSYVIRIGDNICITERLEPDRNVAQYGNAANQAKLAASACTLVHEVVHLVESRPYVEEEVVCRTLQLLLVQDLLTGVSYQSFVTRDRRVGILQPIGATLIRYIDDQNHRLDMYRRGKLIDQVLSIETYREHLEADLVIRSFNWWGGICNREMPTRGYYLRVLAAEGRDARHDLILRILESFASNTEWRQAGLAARDIEQIRGVLNFALYSTEYYRRIQAVQRTLGLDLGARQAG